MCVCNLTNKNLTERGRAGERVAESVRWKLRERDVVQIITVVLSDLDDEDVLVAVVSDHVVINSRRNRHSKVQPSLVGLRVAGCRCPHCPAGRKA